MKIVAKAFEAPSSVGSGISMSLKETRGQQFIRLGITALAQEGFFGGGA